MAGERNENEARVDHSNEPVVEMRDPRTGQIHPTLYYYVPQMIERGMEVADPVAYRLARYAARHEALDNTPVGPDDSAGEGPPALPIPVVPTAENLNSDASAGPELDLALLDRPVMRMGAPAKDDGRVKDDRVSARMIPIRAARRRF